MGLRRAVELSRPWAWEWTVGLQKPGPWVCRPMGLQRADGAGRVADLVQAGHAACPRPVARLPGMKVGLQISSFTWPGGDASIGPTLAAIVRSADDAGFDSIWVMDHFLQIGSVGTPEEPMLEGMTTLGFMAAHSRRARLGLMVGGIHYRQAGLWIKAATTLDVLSSGRAWFGIGAAWNEQESRAWGFPMPGLGERFEMLEETLQLAHAAWQGQRWELASRSTAATTRPVTPSTHHRRCRDHIRPS